MRPIAKRLVLRCPASAQRTLRTRPSNTTCRGYEGYVPAQQEGTIRSHADLERSALGVQRRARTSDGTAILKTTLFVRVVAERLVLGEPTSTQGGANFEPHLVIGGASDLKFSTKVEGPVVRHRDRIGSRGLFFDGFPIDDLRESSGWAARHHLGNPLEGHEIRLTPGLASTLKEVVVRSTALTHMNAQPPVPADRRFLSGILEHLLVAHKGNETTSGEPKTGVDPHETSQCNFPAVEAKCKRVRQPSRNDRQ